MVTYSELLEGARRGRLIEDIVQIVLQWFLLSLEDESDISFYTQTAG